MRILSAAAAGVVLLVVLVLLPYDRASAARQASPADDLVPVELSTVGVDRLAGAPIVLLREPESGDIVPIWVGTAEAQAIALALHGIEVPRPMTHDLMASLLTELSATVDEVIVHDLRENTYIGAVRLRISGEDTVRTVDSRPSDALALALRTGARIRVARKILVAAPDFDFVAPAGSDQIVHVLGITVVAPTPALRREFTVDERPGVIVTAVAGRAQELGLRRGDLVVDVNGESVREPMDFFRTVRATQPGSPVRITYFRGGAEHRIELPVDLPPAPRGTRPGMRVHHERHRDSAGSYRL